MKHKSTGKQITAVETTTDKITGRGGITFILRYLEKILRSTAIALPFPDNCLSIKTYGTIPFYSG
jgi:hypothetical protein